MTETASVCRDFLSDNDARNYIDLLRSGCLNVHFQPIVNLRSGEVKGVEALGRLNDHGCIVSPKVFLQHFSALELRDLLFQSLDQGLAALESCSATHPNLRLSLNVDPSMFFEHEFASAFLDRASIADPSRITIEILESGEILNTKLACEQIAILRTSGIRIALDDVGSAYSSLMRLRTLPVDAIKLDQAFVCELHRRPEDLVFVSSMMSMARGLKKTLVVEGVETTDILDALRVLGVEMAQGYAIARPMSVTSLVNWLGAYTPEAATSQPHSLLGSYAAHLCLIEACRAMLNQPLKSSWMTGAENPHACLIGKFFDQQEWHNTELGLSHKRLHAILPFYHDQRFAWNEAAEDFQDKLEKSIQQEIPDQRQGYHTASSITHCNCSQSHDSFICG